MIAFDTNILLYAADRRDQAKREIATRLISSSTDVVMPWQVACEFIAASRKLADHGFTAVEAWDQLNHYLRAFHLAMPGATILDRARLLQLEQQWSYWDAMLVAACMEAGVSRLYSEDMPGRSAPAGLEIVNPFA